MTHGPGSGRASVQVGGATRKCGAFFIGDADRGSAITIPSLCGVAIQSQFLLACGIEMLEQGMDCVVARTDSS